MSWFGSLVWLFHLGRATGMTDLLRSSRSANLMVLVDVGPWLKRKCTVTAVCFLVMKASLSGVLSFCPSKMMVAGRRFLDFPSTIIPQTKIRLPSHLQRGECTATRGMRSTKKGQKRTKTNCTSFRIVWWSSRVSLVSLPTQYMLSKCDRRPPKDIDSDLSAKQKISIPSAPQVPYASYRSCR